MKALLVVLAIVAVLGAPVGFYLAKQAQPLPYGPHDVEAIWLQPVPEGPVPPTFARRPTKGELPLSRVEGALPSPLPRDLWQGFRCEFGGDVVLELRTGDEIRYGPCRRPAAIERLRVEVLQELRREMKRRG